MARGLGGRALERSSTDRTGCGRWRISARRFPRSMTGSVNEVARAQLNPIPSSQDTSTRSVPGAKAARSCSVTKISGAPGSCSTRLTTMSLSARKLATGTGPAGVSAHVRWGRRRHVPVGLSVSSGSVNGGHLPVGQNAYVVNPWAFRAVTAPRAVAPNPGTQGGAEAAAIAARDARQLHCVQN